MPACRAAVLTQTSLQATFTFTFKPSTKDQQHQIAVCSISCFVFPGIVANLAQGLQKWNPGFEFPESIVNTLPVSVNSLRKMSARLNFTSGEANPPITSRQRHCAVGPGVFAKPRAKGAIFKAPPPLSIFPLLTPQTKKWQSQLT